MQHQKSDCIKIYTQHFHIKIYEFILLFVVLVIAASIFSISVQRLFIKSY